MRNTSFLQTQTILRSLEFTLGKGGFKNAAQKKAASSLIKSMNGRESVSGRHQQLHSLLERGATLQELRQMAVDQGMKLLSQSAMEKVRAGLSSLEETLAITVSQD